VPLAVVSEVGGGRNAGKPWAVCPVMVKRWNPEASQEAATQDAATTTRALRTADTPTMDQEEKPLDGKWKVNGLHLSSTFIQSA